MKILWVTNLLIGALAEKKGLKKTSGQWLEAELADEIEKNENELFVCTSGAVEERYTEKNVSYIVLPHGGAATYVVTDEHVEAWKRLLDEIVPDVILVWGTEYDIGRCVLTANAKKYPSVLYIQGVMRAVAKNYRGGLTDAQIKGFSTLLEKIRHRTVFDMERVQAKKAKNEEETVSLADAIITENEWSMERYREISPDICIFRNRLPIKSEFSSYCWKESTYIPHTLVTTAAAYPLKGLHKLIEAVNRLKGEYPDIILYVPGPNNFEARGILARLHQSGYCKWIRGIIKKCSLSENIKFVGPQTTKQYATLMQNSQVFVTASATENHCSALREAMSVGVPCVASHVGGIPEYATDGVNCSLYDYEDSGVLAEKIRELFEDEELRALYSTKGKETIKAMYLPNDTFSGIGEICQKVAEAHNAG